MMPRTPLPQSIVWEVTSRCDQECLYCYNIWTTGGPTRPVDLDTNGAKRVLANLAAGAPRLKSLTLSGGEPLLRDDLATLIAEARSLLPHTQINIATNGRNLDRDKANGLKAAGIAVIQLTLLSANPKTHDSLTGRPGSFDRVIAAIACAKAAGMLVAVFFVAMRRNIPDFSGAARLALAVGADTVIFNRFQPGGRALELWKELTPAVSQLEEATAQIADLRKIAQISFGTILPPCETPHLRVTRKSVLSCPIGT
jgi:PqqA peptide cyclase